MFKGIRVSVCLLSLLAFGVTACSPGKVVVNGDVFIVSRAGINFKLGLVDVYAIPEDEMRRHLAEWNKKAEADRRIKQVELDSLKADYDKAEAECKAIEDRYYSAGSNQTVIQNEDGSVSPIDERTQAVIVADERRKLAPEKVEKQQKRDKAKEQYLKAQAVLANWPPVEMFFQGLPPSVAKATTDADGKFVMKLPAGKYALVAQATREVLSNAERYHWMVWADFKSGDDARVLLSNNNLATGANLR